MSNERARRNLTLIEKFDLCRNSQDKKLAPTRKELIHEIKLLADNDNESEMRELAQAYIYSLIRTSTKSLPHDQAEEMALRNMDFLAIAADHLNKDMSETSLLIFTLANKDDVGDVTKFFRKATGFEPPFISEI